MEHIPSLHRKSPARRSSYAFSHQEGYAHLITQGTILRRSPKVNSEILRDFPIPSDEEGTPSSLQESLGPARKTTFLGKKICQPQGRESSQDRQPSSAGSSLLTVERQSTLYPQTQPTVTKRSPSNVSRPSGSSQKTSSLQESQLSPSEDHSQLCQSVTAFPPDLGEPARVLGGEVIFVDNILEELAKSLAKGTPPPDTRKIQSHFPR
jgi:phospholipid-translocating ATPase